jgi:hypothetical protein
MSMIVEDLYKRVREDLELSGKIKITLIIEYFH